MMNHRSQSPADKWAVFRFSVIGPLLSRSIPNGELGKELHRLALKSFIHPISGEPVSFHFSTLERWYYQARNAEDPIAALSRKVRSDIGQCKAMSSRVLSLLSRQYKTYPGWSYKLHCDNLVAELALLGACESGPSYSTVVRHMQRRGWLKKGSLRQGRTAGEKKAAERLQHYEQRSYEAQLVHQLWHLDFHHGSLRIVDANGDWHTPKALCILDDRSRLCCHIQWYLDETAQTLIHGLTQAFHKRGLPRSLMTDNGSAMIARETRNGLLRTGINHTTTLPHSPYQNGKQECFWATLEGRLLAMLVRKESLSLRFLNNATQAWVEMEYHRSVHNEIGMSPLSCLLKTQDVCRPAPDNCVIQQAFTLRESRTQRRSDGTISISGVRFEVPSRFGHLQQLHVAYTSWDKSVAWLVDERTADVLATIYPQDKQANASGRRRMRVVADFCALPDTADENQLPALMRRYMAEYAETGAPPAYIPREVHNEKR